MTPPPLEPGIIAIGTQRLAQRAPKEAAQLLERGVDLGVHWLDVSDMYGPGPGDAERLVASVARRIAVCTKGGLIRRGRRWEPDGRARHLMQAAHASRERLGVSVIDLYLLHAPDPRTPLRTSVRALRQLVQDGVVRAIGLSNVTVGQLREASETVQVACVEVPFGPLDPGSVRSGILEVCLADAIPVLAHRPLGGADRQRRIGQHAGLRELAAARGCTPHELALAWVADLGVIPLPGPSRVETLESCVRAATIQLDDDERAVLDAAFPEIRQLRRPRAERAPSAEAAGDVRVVMGSPGAGKSTAVTVHAAKSYARLNRDERGGTLAGLLPALSELLASGARHVVLDNTYPSRASRNGVIETAWAQGVPARCTWLDTSPSDCERNVLERIVDRTGRLPGPGELEALAKQDPAILVPQALLRYRAQLEPPTLDEGWAELVRQPFTRRPTPGARAVLADPRHLEVFAAVWIAAHQSGWEVLLAGWEPGRNPEEAVADVEARAAAAGVRAHAAICVHPPGPPVCWCRKPWLGLPVLLAREHGVDLAQTVVVATTPSDRTLAAKLRAPVADTPESLVHLVATPDPR